MVIETPPRAGASVRWLAVILLAAAPVLVVAATYGEWSGRLPDPLPTHWEVGGQVDGTTTLVVFFAINLMLAATGAATALVGARLARLRWRIRRALACSGAAISAFGGGLWLTVAGLALDHPDPYQVPSPSWPASGLPRVDLPAGQRAAWSEVTYPGPVPYLLVAGLLALAVAMSAWVNVWAASPVLLSVALTWYLFTARLLVDRRGLRVGFGPWGWPRVKVPLAEIESAEVTTVRPSEWGGWGYRVRPGGRAVVMRRGPGVRLALSDSRVFVTTTRDPQTVAGLVNTLLDQR